MFKNTFQSGFLSILYSIGSKPLQIWDKKVKNGHIKRITDEDIQSLVLEVVGSNVSTTYITCPADPQKTLGIKLPYLVMIVKNLKKYFTFEIQVKNQITVGLLFDLDCFRYWMTRTSGGGSERATTSRRPASSLSSAPCQCGWTTGGTRSSSTWLTSPGGHMEQTTWKRSACRCMQTAGSAGFTFQIGCTPRTNCRPSSSCSCRYRATRCEHQSTLEKLKGSDSIGIWSSIMRTHVSTLAAFQIKSMSTMKLHKQDTYLLFVIITIICNL